MFTQFAPTTYAGWHVLLLKMNRSPFLAALHLAEFRKVWEHDVNSSWQKFFRWVGDKGG